MYLNAQRKILVFVRFLTFIAKDTVRKELSFSWQVSAAGKVLCYLPSDRVGYIKCRGNGTGILPSLKNCSSGYSLITSYWQRKSCVAVFWNCS